MTDKQILDIVLKRASIAVKANGGELISPKVVITCQYGKKLYFSLKFENDTFPHPIAFSNHGSSMVFMLPELPDHLMGWKRDIIKRIANNTEHVIYDIDAFPKEIVHIFSSAIISALNTEGMGVHIMAMGLPTLFNPNETYETVQVEADLMEFESNE